MPRFDWNLLASLDALLRNKHVTAAAEEIGVSQPTMSGMLRRLRDQLGDPLIVRVGSNYELTERALELSGPVRQALLSIEDLVRPVETLDFATANRCIRIMASEFSQFLLLPYFFRRAAELAPGLTFEVLPIFDPVSRVYHGDVDVALTAAPLTEIPVASASLIRSRRLLDEPFVALVDQNHPLGEAATLEELLSYPHIETRFPGLSTSVEDGMLNTLDTSRNRAIIVPSFVAVPPMIVGTDRVCVFPQRLLSVISLKEPIRTIRLPEGYKPSLSLRVLWHVRHDFDPLHRWVRSILHEAAAQLDDSEAPT